MSKKTLNQLQGEGYEIVHYAADMVECPSCGDPWCEKHEEHYGECGCIGPTEENVDYQESRGGTLMGKRLKEPTPQGETAYEEDQKAQPSPN